MSKRAPLILFTAGGTGGHVYPALAVATEMRERGYRVGWIGTKAGLESRVVPEHGIDLHLLKVKGVRGKGIVQRLLALFLLIGSMFKALWLIARLKPACVVGMGGYVAGPAGLSAWLLRKPLMIHEQNAIPGTTNRMLAPFARRIAVGFEEAFPSSDKVMFTGNPVREALLSALQERAYSYDGSRPLRLLIVGGSLGAHPINDVMPGTIRRMQRDGAQDIEFWHQTGERNYAGMRERYASFNPGIVRAEPFIEDMQAAFSWADLVLCRAGALTVAELAVTGRPAILVPLPQAIDDHQTANAGYLVRAGAAFIMLQSELDAYRLSKRLRDLMADPEKLAAMSEAAYDAAAPDATRRIADACEALCHD